MNNKKVEFVVGLFLLAGFSAIAVMVVMFGRVGKAMEETYEITVQFPNASGLQKGYEVLISGASIGSVSSLPELGGSNYSVKVKLKIRADVKIPRTSYFQIRTTGLLGDSYVDIVPPAKFTEADYANPGEEITGTRTTGFDDLTSKGSEMIDQLKDDVLKKVSEELDALKLATQNINDRLLTEKNLKNIEVTFENLSKTSQDFSATATKLDAIVAKTDAAVASAQGTMKTIDNTAGELKGAIGDFRKMAESATKTADSARNVMQRIERGDGALGMLLSNRETAENLRVLIANLRRSGVLFYKDRPPEPTPAPRRSR